jgi:hypothetical protein
MFTQDGRERVLEIRRGGQTQQKRLQTVGIR